MIESMLEYLSGEGLAMAGMMLLAFILYDDKALARLEKHRIRRLMLVPIGMYFLLVAIEVAGIALRCSR